MIKVAISGCNGRMGHVLTDLCNKENIEVAFGFDITESNHSYPVYSSPADCTEKADVVVDFSNTSALDGLIAYAANTKTPVIFCTTGYSAEQKEKIAELSKTVPMFWSGNMSLGVNLMMELCKRAAEILGQNFDVEIIEKHHNQKLDAPSGTALMIADAVNQGLEYDAEYVYDRHSVRKKRSKNEIGISAIRGGTIVGEHEVIFAGQDEVIEIKHSAYSRNIFAAGAVKAIKFMATVTEPGLYNMGDVLK